MAAELPLATEKAIRPTGKASATDEQRIDWLSRGLQISVEFGAMLQWCRIHAATIAASIFFIASRSAS